MPTIVTSVDRSLTSPTEYIGETFHSTKGVTVRSEGRRGLRSIMAPVSFKSVTSGTTREPVVLTHPVDGAHEPLAVQDDNGQFHHD
jgi:hypothetical protein